MRTKTGTLLIVDDNTGVLNSLELFLKYHFEKVIPIRNPNLIGGQLESGDIDVVLLDMNFTAGVNTGNEGIFWLRKILEHDPAIVVVMITAYGDVELAVKAIREGATDFIVKPWDNQKLLATLEAGIKLRQSRREVRELKLRQKQHAEDAGRNFQKIIGDSPPIKELQKTIAKVARTGANVLILGENGTGKELIAREIHRQSKRHNNEFVPVDLGALSESLFESELFGHVKGAFTDARDDRIGRFQSASNGTIFLDEIGNLNFSLQAKILTAIEQRTITPIGTNKPIPVNIRLLAATNRDLQEMIANNIFREDLYYRLNTVQITAPPLRERGKDILLLAEHYLAVFRQRYERPRLRFTEHALNTLLSHQWPGNIRELRHTVEKAVILAEGDRLQAEDFRLTGTVKAHDMIKQPLSLEEGEKLIIENALKNNSWNISETARELKVGRQTLYRKIDRYGLQ